MDNVSFIRPDERYIRSYWETFDTIAKEKKFFATNESFPFDSTVEFIKGSIHKGFPHIFVIDTEKDICVGWCDATPKTDTIGYLGMGLLPQYREHGIGKNVLKQIVELSRAYGYHKIELDVLRSNERAIYVYESIGFTKTNLITGGFVWHDTLVKEDVVQMVINLK